MKILNVIDDTPFVRLSKINNLNLNLGNTMLKYLYENKKTALIPVVDTQIMTINECVKKINGVSPFELTCENVICDHIKSVNEGCELLEYDRFNIVKKEDVILVILIDVDIIDFGTIIIELLSWKMRDIVKKCLHALLKIPLQYNVLKSRYFINKPYMDNNNNIVYVDKKHYFYNVNTNNLILINNEIKDDDTCIIKFSKCNISYLKLITNYGYIILTDITDATLEIKINDANNYDEKFEVISAKSLEYIHTLYIETKSICSLYVNYYGDLILSDKNNFDKIVLNFIGNINCKSVNCNKFIAQCHFNNINQMLINFNSKLKLKNNKSSVNVSGSKFEIGELFGVIDSSPNVLNKNICRYRKFNIQLPYLIATTTYFKIHLDYETLNYILLYMNEKYGNKTYKYIQSAKVNDMNDIVLISDADKTIVYIDHSIDKCIINNSKIANLMFRNDITINEIHIASSNIRNICIYDKYCEPYTVGSKIRFNINSDESLNINVNKCTMENNTIINLNNFEKIMN